MRILLLGGTGFIGRHVAARLLSEGHALVLAVKEPERARRRFPQAEAQVETMAIDLARDTDPDIWLPRLAGIDAVVNAAGLLRGPGIDAVHRDGPAALYQACAQAGVKRVIHISAAGADEAANTDYARSKAAAETWLRGRDDLDWLILRPSLVYHQGSYGGTSLMRGLAGLPGCVALPGDGAMAFHPIHAEDLAAGIAECLQRPELKHICFEPGGPERLSLREMVLAWRAWLDLPPAPVLRLPLPLLHLAGWLGDRLGSGPISQTSLRQLQHGAAGDAGPWLQTIQHPHLRFADALALQPSHTAERWQARLYFLRPLARAALVLLWLLSGLIGLLAEPNATAAVRALLGLPDAAHAPLLYAFCVLDIGLALALLRRWGDAFARAAMQAAVVLGYSLVLSIAQPDLWLEPLGPLLKNLPILVLILVDAAWEEDR
ncbi:SDR family oxidoreductase [Ferrovibrio sp.]|uniref:SDR family oxidoreductase n=1 Tax=Ferrovibrio sp. TaxID=1917215 RepID=UPI0035AEB9EA